MIQTLKNKHENSSIAIIGSGPTALFYVGREDIAIALSGAIQIDAPFNYFQAWDQGLPKQSWFHTKPEKTRIIGVGLVPLDRIVYPTLHDEMRAKIPKPTVLAEHPRVQALPPPTEPHIWFTYEVRKNPIFDKEMENLSSRGNIAICALETAIIMGASQINIYGIDMADRYYFYDNRRKGEYGEHSYRYMNSLILLCQQNGIQVAVCRGEKSNITEGDTIERGN